VIITHFKSKENPRGKIGPFPQESISLKFPKDNSAPQYSFTKFRFNYRSKVNVIRTYAIVLDIDNQSENRQITWEDCEEWFCDSGLQFSMHTTRSHTQDLHKIRAIFPLEKPCTINEFKPTVEALIEFLGMNEYKDCIDEKSYCAEQGWFYPSHVQGSLPLNLSQQGEKFKKVEMNIAKTLAGVDFKNIIITDLLEAKSLKFGQKEPSGFTRCDCPWHEHDQEISSCAFIQEDGQWPKITCHANKCQDYGFMDFLALFTKDELAKYAPKNKYFKRKNKEGKPKALLCNFQALLQMKGIKITLNTVLKDFYFDYQGKKERLNDFHIERIIEYASDYEMTLSTKRAGELVNAVCDLPENEENPIAEWILSSDWDGERDYMKELFDTITFQDHITEKDKKFFKRLFDKWLISAVAVLFEKGTDAFTKGVLVLQGEQSVGKTSWIMRLLPKKLSEYIYSGASLNLQDKDSRYESICGWITELGELDATFRKTDIAKLKAFITTVIDLLRLPYRKSWKRFPRQTIFCASVNDKEFLNDTTGNSRWWVFPVKKLDWGHKVNLQQVYAQSYFEYKTRGVGSWLLDSKDEKKLQDILKEFEPIQSWEEGILKMFEWGSDDRDNYVMVSDIYEKLTGRRDCTGKASREIGAILRKLGLKPKNTTIAGSRGNFWPCPPESVEFEAVKYVDRSMYM
jgi:hypothetical protein